MSEIVTYLFTCNNTSDNPSVSVHRDVREDGNDNDVTCVDGEGREKANGERMRECLV